ncbi:MULTISPECIES: thioredoxin [unclassified Pelosinus]|jgi:thioredoxin 1|uniref:thioredoxin n=1 Tax=unclassified Pelosinus TaxID=2629460 RepID=UPI0004D1EF37|nr:MULTISPECIES: thioredoxin [unclassified Pelosinus]AIF52221.1 thioredoxin [Pelosinus sp. UFO1]GMB00844.1 thioredoxin [Pelosinus sp. IPA-1]
MSVLNIADENEFKEKISQKDKPVLVDFWASWCGPCKMVAPELEAVGQEYEGKAVVMKVNVDEQQQLASNYNVMGIPTLLLFKDGVEVERIVGYRPRKDLMDAIDKVI